MSHQPERKEKNCLNCGVTVVGRYCHVCGQENVVTKESFWSLTKHFVYDILHFDGKFWHTLKYLIIRPGYVARQYCEGKRNSYLHPIRMYLFTSAIFFLLFFALKGNELQIRETPLKKADRKEAIEGLKKELQQKPGDSPILSQLSLLEDSTRDVYAYQLDTSGNIKFSMGNSRQFRSVEHYDSVQNALPRGKKDGWISKAFTRRGLELKEKYSNDMRQGLNLMWSDFLHKLPYMLFLSLPFFAFILKLLYMRRKNFFYSDHAVFTLYHYIFSFILLMAMLALGQIRDWTGFFWIQWFMITLLFIWSVYLLIEMKIFYRQRWIKTIIKFLLMNSLGFVVIIILFLVFLLISLFT